MLDMKKVKRDALKQKLAKELEEIESLKKKCSVVTQQDKENSTELTRVLDTISKIPVV
jgi:bacterioferritin (cytochrome b1)